MTHQLSVKIGQFSDKGRKALNQDFHAASIPKEPMLSNKGIAIALADGISSSNVSQIASEAAVTGFLEDYYCTSEAWSVKKSAQKVLQATNSWLHSQTRQSQYRYDKDKGYVCTFSAIILKSTTAHLFHVGDTRIYRVIGKSLEQLTNDHRYWVTQQDSYLTRALGIAYQLEIDYQSLQISKDDLFFLASDGVYENVSPEFVINTIDNHPEDLNHAAQLIVDEATAQGSTDNLTAQIVRIEQLPLQNVEEIYQQITELPFPPFLEARMTFEGYNIIREIYSSSRSHVYLAVDTETQNQVVIKTPAVEHCKDPAFLENFLMEEWVARRINSPYVLKPCKQTRKRNYLYVTTEYIEGQTLKQWMIDNPKPKLENVRLIIEQIAKGLRAFHRLEMLHQDLRPDNIMIDKTGTAKIIDFGAARVAGILEINKPVERGNLLGTMQYTAPEYFIDDPASARSDLFSLAVISYQMITGRLPYGTKVSKAKTKAAQMKLNYQPITDFDKQIPGWVDNVLQKALHPNPYKRYGDTLEFIHELRHPNQEFLNKTRPPLIERNPVMFWKSVSLVLSIMVIILIIQLE